MPYAEEQGEKRPRADSAFSYVRVRGLPYSATREHLREFFATAGVIVADADVVLRHNASGEAFVRVPCDLLAAALALNKGVLGKRYLELFETEQAEFERCESSATQDGSKRLVRMRGLPWGATAEDVSSFFEGHGLTGVHIVTRSDGRQTGEAYVELETEEAAARAMELHRKEMSGRYIELFAATKGEMLSVLAAHGVDVQQTAQAEEDKCAVKMRGMPWTATAADVFAFFNGIPIEGGMAGIALPLSPDGRASGEAYVLFESPEAAQEARKRDKHQMQNRWVDVTLATLTELRARVPQLLAGARSAGGRGFFYNQPGFAHAAPLDLPPHLSSTLQADARVCIRLRGLGPAVTEDDVAAFFRAQPHPCTPAAVRLVFKHDNPSGWAYALFASEQDCFVGLQKQSGNLCGQQADLVQCSLKEMQYVCSRDAGTPGIGTNGSGGACGHGQPYAL